VVDRRLLLAAIAVTVVAGAALDRAAHHSLTGHMLQHAVLWCVAAPLLAYALPPSRRTWAGEVTIALVVQTLALWIWHLPPIFDAALDTAPLHGFEHLTFVIAPAFLLRALRRPHPASALVLFVAAFPGTALGAGMLLATHTWYDAYERLADQQLAAVVMWSGMGIAYVLAAVILFARSLAQHA
jgi:putative membrane protein